MPFFTAMDPKPTTRLPNEGLVVTEDGVRKDGTVHQTNEAASAAAANRKKPVNEQGGQPQVAVKQQLFG